MIIDTSALIAILDDEPEAAAYVEAIPTDIPYIGLPGVRRRLSEVIASYGSPSA